MRSFNGRARGFTLVELLVVIGIIALLLGVLLPVLSGVTRRGRQLKCQANLRSAVQMFLAYAAENKGSLPYGWYYNKSDDKFPPYGGHTWKDLAGDERLTTCFALISKMSSKHYKGDDKFIATGSSSNPEGSKLNYAPFLRCPEAEQVLPHICSYAVQMIAFMTPFYERPVGGGSYALGYPWPIQDKPARITDLLPFMILIHDTAVVPGMIEDVGYVTDADVDAQEFWRDTQFPQRRYYQKNDPYTNATGALARFRQNNPVAFAGSTGSNAWFNIDPIPTGPEGFNGPYYQGNLRFRHGNNDVVNVGYADGRVEGIQASFHPDKSMKKHSIPRRAFMIKWPNGFGLRPNGP